MVTAVLSQPEKKLNTLLQGVLSQNFEGEITSEIGFWWTHISHPQHINGKQSLEHI